MIPDTIPYEGFEISPRFRRSIEERIARLEKGADLDESQLTYLSERDHIRRQLRLIAAQRAEALRMRLFLDQAGTRLPGTSIILDGKLSK
jgi:hypothetical protein